LNVLIVNGKIITWEKENRILAGHALYIDGGKIVEIGLEAELKAKYSQSETLDARGQFVMPGNICAHTHFYGMYSRGMAIPGDAPAEFSQILKKLWWPLDLALDEDAVAYSALICLIDAIKHGTTTLFDHHASPNCIDGSLDVIAEAVDKSGLRACLCYEVTDRNGESGAKAGIAENVRFIKKLTEERRQKTGSANRLAASFGLHAPLTLSDATLEASRAAASQETGFHIHVSESRDDGQYVASLGKGRPVDWLNRHGILGPRSIIAHGVHLEDVEMDQVAESGTWITHQPRSNMNNAVGVANVEAMLARGVRVGLGNDGFSNTMWDEWKATYLLHKLANGDPRSMNGYTVVEMAIYNNAALAELYFPEAPIGMVMPGAAADLIFVDYQAPTPVISDNLPWHILFGFNESMVTTTIVDGQVLMRDRQLLTLDEAAIAAEARELAPEVWERYESYAGKY
jgi:putative selenium metabolism protein SsnA